MRKNFGLHASFFKNRIACFRAGTGNLQSIRPISVVHVSIKDRSDLQPRKLCCGIKLFRIKVCPLLYRDLRCRICRHCIERVASAGIFVRKDRLPNICMCAHLTVRYDIDKRIIYHQPFKRCLRNRSGIGLCGIVIDCLSLFGDLMPSNHRCHRVRHSNIKSADVHILR